MTISAMMYTNHKEPITFENIKGLVGGNETWLYLLEVFKDWKPLKFKARPMVLKRITSVTELGQERPPGLLNEVQLHATRRDMHRGPTENNCKNQTKAQLLQNARTNVLPVNSQIGNWAVILRTQHQKHKLDLKLMRYMRIFGVKSDGVLVV